MKLKGLVSLITGLAMVGTGIWYTINKTEDLGINFKKSYSIVTLHSEPQEVSLKDRYGKTSKKNLTTIVDLDKEKNTLLIGNYTEGFSDENKKQLPIKIKYTRINPFSKTFIVHPKEVQISEIKQRAYLIPKPGWDSDLKPYKKHKEAQLIIEGGEKIVDFAMRKIPIPFFKEFFDSYKRYSSIKSKQQMKEIVEKLHKGYTATIIPSHLTKKLFGSTITAREYDIKFNTSKINGETEMYFVTKIALGDSGYSSSGSFPNKYGESKRMIIPFTLNKKKEEIKIESQKPKRIRKKNRILEEIEDINISDVLKYVTKQTNKILGETEIQNPFALKFENYFLQGKELEYIKPYPKDSDKLIKLFMRREGLRFVMRDKNLIGKIQNPRILKDNNVSIKNKEKGIKNIGMGYYYIPRLDSRRRKELDIIVSEFISKEKKNKFLKNKSTFYPRFIKGNLVIMEQSKLLQSSRYLSKTQKKVYLDFLFNYEQRTGTELQVHSNKAENSKLLQRLKEMKKRYDLQFRMNR